MSSDFDKKKQYKSCSHPFLKDGGSRIYRRTAEQPVRAVLLPVSVFSAGSVDLCDLFEFRPFGLKISFGDVSWDFVLAHIHCALGTVPAAMGREVFDLSGLAPNTIVAMNADVKADLSKPDDFTYYGRRRDR